MTARLSVPAPARVPAGYGLLAAASVVPFTSDRELHSGVQFEAVGCPESHLLTYTCEGGIVLHGEETASPGSNKALRSGPPDLVQGEPFVVYDSFWCGPRDDARAIAQQRLAIGAGTAVELAMQTGVVNPLGLPQASVLTTTALTPTQALAVLQQAVPAVAGAVIHAPRGAAALLGSTVMQREGNVLRDALGNTFAFYSGWDNNQSPNDALGVNVNNLTFWMYGSGPVTVRRGDVITSPPSGFGFDTANNDTLVLAEQPYIITVECGIWAVPVAGGFAGLPPRVTSIIPATVVSAAGSPLTLHVYGRGFATTSKINFNGADLATTFVSDGELTAPVSPNHAPGAVPVLVRNADGMQSGAVRFTYTAAVVAAERPAPVKVAAPPAPAPAPAPPQAPAPAPAKPTTTDAPPPRPARKRNGNGNGNGSSAAPAGGTT